MTDADTMRRYAQTRDDLVARLRALENLLRDDRREALVQAAQRLARAKFVLAVVGEFSSGKSFLLNALLEKFRYDDTAGAKRLTGLLAVDINPSTATITELDYGPQDEATAYYEGGRSERIPLDALSRFIAVGQSAAADVPVRVLVKARSPFLERGFVVADTPGLASVNPAHRRATLHFLPAADAVLYLIDTQQPFTDGDAAFLGIIRQHVDSIFIVQTKIDLWRQPESDGRPAWQHAYDRIARLAAVHAPETRVCALSAREYAEGTLEGDPGEIEASGFPQFLSALNASLVKRTGRARLRRASERAGAAAADEIARIDRDLAMLARSERDLQAERVALGPQLLALDAALRAQCESLRTAGLARRDALSARARELADELERALSQAFDTADVARLRDRERLHGIVDRAIAHIVGEFAHGVADLVTGDLEAAREHAHALLPVRWNVNDAAAVALGGESGASLWRGDVRTAIAAAIVLEAIGGPGIAVVHAIASRFAQRPPGRYMKRELTADLRAEIFPHVRGELDAFVRRTGERIERLYGDLAETIERAAAAKRDVDSGSIERALQAHAAGAVVSEAAALRERRGAIEREAAQAEASVSAFIEREGEIEPPEPVAGAVRVAHAEPSLDPAAYGRGLRPQRWRVAILGALRRGKSGLIDAFAGESVLADGIAGSVRFPIHVRYGEQHAAFALSLNGAWNEIPFAQAADAAATSPVLVVLPWTLPRELVLVHAPAFDSGDAHAEDVNVVVASHASEVLCLFSRQLSDRELDLYERVAEFARPLLFAHTLADNETPGERRHVVELAQQYLTARGIPVERIFVVSAREYAQARDAGRAPAGWNELDALRSTLEAHAESHMARLERLAKARATAPTTGGEPAANRTHGSGFLERLFGKGRAGNVRRRP